MEALDRAANASESRRAFDSGLARVAHRPIDVSLQITSVCNVDCAVCSEHDRPWGERMGRGLRWMSIELFERLEREILLHAIILRIGISGEPSLSPHLGEFTRRAHALGCRVEVTTNGTRLDAPDLALVLARCTSRLQVSVDAATASTYERLRRGARWDPLLANLKLVAEARQSGETVGRFVLSFMLLASNLDELAPFVELAADLGVDEVVAHPVVPVNAEGARERVDRDPARLHAALAVARRSAEQRGIELTLVGIAREQEACTSGVDTPHTEARSDVEDAPAHAVQPYAGSQVDAPSSTRTRILCHRPTSEISILHDGRVYVCQHPLAYEKMLVGDLAATDFEAIWNGPLYRELRRALFTGNPPPICATCPIAEAGATSDDGFRAARAGPALADWQPRHHSLEPDPPA